MAKQTGNNGAPATDATPTGRSVAVITFHADADANDEGTRSPTPGSQFVKFTFADGTLLADVNDLNADVAHQAFLHGVKQKIADAYAGAKSREETPFELASAMWSQLSEVGKWTDRAEAGPRVGDLAQAYVDVRTTAGQTVGTVEEIRTALLADEKILASVRGHPMIQARVAEIVAARKAERATSATADTLPTF